ncbi:myb/SANT-like DNA-binding domain-containing protein 4 [Liolophura sinensis]|uniref:myb/SANT-like DNA-binding domain-containing protein 4 n=1 Tax=Liolophura sinensis TaxID=3198878 RepID=UPI0031598753
MLPVARKRNANFTPAEFDTLVDNVEKYQDVIHSKISDVVTKAKKDVVWRAITDQVNAASRFSCQRSVKEIKKKWNDSKCKAKKRAALAKTNPAIAPRLSSSEQKIISIINSMAANGIDEGIDTGDAINTLPATSTSPVLNIPEDDSAYTTVYVDDVGEDEPSKFNSFTGTIPTLYNSFNDKIMMEKLITIKKARLEVERERLEVEKARLEVEQRRLKLEEKRLTLKEKRLCLYL